MFVMAVMSWRQERYGDFEIGHFRTKRQAKPIGAWHMGINVIEDRTEERQLV
jgi:hypothetical protein